MIKQDEMQSNIFSMNDYCSLLLLVLIISGLILCYRMVFYHRRNGFMQFMKFILVPLTAIGGWIIYFIGYYGFGHEQILSSALLAVFSTARLFILGNDLIEIHSYVKGNHLFMLWFSSIAATAAFISASILLHLFGKRLITWCKIWIDRSEETHIFFAVNLSSLSLAKDLLKNNKSRLVLFFDKMDKNENSSLFHEAEEAGAFLISSESVLESLELENEESIVHSPKEETGHIHHDDSKRIYLNKYGLRGKIISRTVHLYFLSTREEWNLGMARTVLGEINSLSPGKPVNLHIRTSSAELEGLFHQSLSGLSAAATTNLINLPEIASRQLISKFNPVNWITKDTQQALASEGFTAMVIGFGQTGRAVLKKLIEFGHFPGVEFNAIVVDKDIQQKIGRFEACFPGLFPNYNIEFVETGPGREEFYHLIKQHANKLDYIVLTLGDDSLNINTATDIQQFLLKLTGKRILIIAQVKDDTNYNLLFDLSMQVGIAIFGRGKDIFTENIIVRGEMEKTAKKIHDYYNLKMDEGKKRRSWSELSLIKQVSNISAANHIYTKLTLSGITVDDVKQFATSTEFVNFLGKERIMNLAKVEHLRWNAVHFSNGWNTWELSETPENATCNNDKMRKLHACLVAWEDLIPVSERFKEDYYKYDKENVINIFELIKNGVYNENCH